MKGFGSQYKLSINKPINGIRNVQSVLRKNKEFYYHDRFIVIETNSNKEITCYMFTEERGERKRTLVWQISHENYLVSNL